MNGDITDRIFIQMPILKAVEQEDGCMRIHGIASDSGLDVENEIVKASGWIDSLTYLEQQGHFNFDHTEALLGDIQKARIVDPDWVQEKFGIRPSGKALYLEGTVYAPNDEMPEDQRQALQQVRGILKAGGKLGLSVEGSRVRSAPQIVDGKQVTVTTRALATGCAITPRAINPRTFAVPMTLAKSLSAALSTTEQIEGNTVVVVCGSLEPDSPVDTRPGLNKGLGELTARDVQQEVCEQARTALGLQPTDMVWCADLLETHAIVQAETPNTHPSGAPTPTNYRIPYLVVGRKVTIGQPVRVRVEYVPDEEPAAGEPPLEPTHVLGVGVALAKGLRALADIAKGHVKGHYRTTPSGKQVWVNQHDTSRNAAPAQAPKADVYRTIRKQTGEDVVFTGTDPEQPHLRIQHNGQTRAVPIPQELIEAIASGHPDASRQLYNWRRYAARSLAKSLTTTYATAPEGLTGGDAIRCSSLAPRRPRKRRRKLADDRFDQTEEDTEDVETPDARPRRGRKRPRGGGPASGRRPYPAA